jgi:tRNA (mo5U34)-methyltransferase
VGERPGGLNPEEIARRVRELEPWYHNLELAGVQTAPEHVLGDYPRVRWQRFAHAFPDDLSGATVLDVGCSAGFYALEMKRRGASRVIGIDSDRRYLEQARLAAEVSGLELEFRELSVYDVGALRERFDLVLFLGVLHHLRHPLLALDLLYEHVVGDLLAFHCLMRGSEEPGDPPSDHAFTEVEAFERRDYPSLYFIEHRFAGDPGTWWIPNRPCVEAMLRSAGFWVVDRPEPEVYLCRKQTRGVP